MTRMIAEVCVSLVLRPMTTLLLVYSALLVPDGLCAAIASQNSAHVLCTRQTVPCVDHVEYIDILHDGSFNISLDGDIITCPSEKCSLNDAIRGRPTDAENLRLELLKNFASHKHLMFKKGDRCIVVDIPRRSGCDSGNIASFECNIKADPPHCDIKHDGPQDDTPIKQDELQTATVNGTGPVNNESLKSVHPGGTVSWTLLALVILGVVIGAMLLFLKKSGYICTVEEKSDYKSSVSEHLETTTYC